MTQAKKKRPRLSPNARLYKKVYDEEFAELHRDVQELGGEHHVLQGDEREPTERRGCR